MNTPDSSVPTAAPPQPRGARPDPTKPDATICIPAPLKEQLTNEAASLGASVYKYGGWVLGGLDTVNRIRIAAASRALEAAQEDVERDAR